MNPDNIFRDDMIITLVSDRDDMIKLIYHDMRYHDNYRLTLVDSSLYPVKNTSRKIKASIPLCRLNFL